MPWPVPTLPWPSRLLTLALCLAMLTWAVAGTSSHPSGSTASTGRDVSSVPASIPASTVIPTATSVAESSATSSASPGGTSDTSPAVAAEPSTGAALSTALGIAAGRAHAAFAAFLTRYWDPRRHTFVRATGTDLRTARPADFWWQAQAWEAVLDAFEDGDELATRSLVRQVFDARVRAGFAPDFNDDLSWWAMASLRAYALTADPTYLRQARSIAATVWRSWDRSSGGIWWRRSRHDQKNVATNATAAIVEARLARLTGDPRDRAHAVAIFGWLEAHLRRGTVVLDRELANGHVVDEPLTYDYGEYLGAAREMADLTGDVADLGLAEDLADAGMALAVGGVLPDEGTGDGGGFKGIFVGQLALLAHQTGSDRYRSFLEANADAAWAHRRDDGLSGSSWRHAPGSGPVQVLTASSGVRLFEQVAILEREAPSPRALAGAAHTWPSGPGWLIGSSLGD